MTKNEETILNNLVKTLQEYENECTASDGK